MFPPDVGLSHLIFACPMLRRIATTLALFAFGVPHIVAQAQDNAVPAVPDAAITLEQEAFFEKNVRPILLARCLDCHGEKKQEAGVRLDSRAAVARMPRAAQAGRQARRAGAGRA